MFLRSWEMCLDFKLCDVFKIYLHFMDKLRKYEFDKDSLYGNQAPSWTYDPFRVNN